MNQLNEHNIISYKFLSASNVMCIYEIVSPWTWHLVAQLRELKHM